MLRLPLKEFVFNIPKFPNESVILIRPGKNGEMVKEQVH
jgi:hypothetical protein